MSVNSCYKLLTASTAVTSCWELLEAIDSFNSWSQLDPNFTWSYTYLLIFDKYLIISKGQVTKFQKGHDLVTDMGTLWLNQGPKKKILEFQCSKADFSTNVISIGIGDSVGIGISYQSHHKSWLTTNHN